MSKPRYRWWGYAKAMTRAYPAHKELLDSLKSQSTTAAYGGIVRGGGGDGKQLERNALRELPPNDQREYEAVEAAIRQVSRLPDGQERLRLISMVFWSQTHTLQGAAIACNVSYSTAKRWHNKFVERVGANFGFKET